MKTPDQFRLLGKDVRRWDTPSKVNGSAIFGTDVELPGMLYGTVKHCNYCGGKIKNVDDSKAKEIPGVIADTPRRSGDCCCRFNLDSNAWSRKIKIDTTGGDNSLNDKNIFKQFKTDIAQDGVLVAQRGDSISAMRKAEKKVEMEYLSPMQACCDGTALCNSQCNS